MNGWLPPIPAPIPARIMNAVEYAVEVFNPRVMSNPAPTALIAVPTTMYGICYGQNIQLCESDLDTHIVPELCDQDARYDNEDDPSCIERNHSDTAVKGRCTTDGLEVNWYVLKVL
jgi:hypothetical protein